MRGADTQKGSRQSVISRSLLCVEDALQLQAGTCAAPKLCTVANVLWPGGEFELEHRVKKFESPGQLTRVGAGGV